MKKLLMSVILLTAMCGRASAQITPTYTFSPDTTILSSQVNANFALLNNALNRTGGTMTGSLTSQAILPVSDATYDLGTSSFHYRNIFLSSNATVGGTLQVTGTSTLGVTNINGATTILALLTTQALIPTSTATYDLGGNTGKYRDIFISRNYRTVETNMGNSGTAITMDFTNQGPNLLVTRNGNATYTLNAPGPGYYTIRFLHDATANSYTVTFSPSVKFPSGTAPTWTQTSSALDILSLYYDGTTWYGAGQVNFS